MHAASANQSIPQNIHHTVLRASLAQRFNVVEKEVPVADTSFHILKVRDTNALVDAIDQKAFAEDERLPYWADIWTSSLELARACLVDLDVNGKRILEIGCGLGLSGIAAAKAGALVSFSDYEQDALNFCRHNAERNLSEEQQSRVEFLCLDWRNLPKLEPFDMILAADVVYERRNFFPLIDVFQTLLKPNGTAVLTEPCRTIGEHFFELLSEEGFHLVTSKHEVELDGRKSNVLRVMIQNTLINKPYQW